MRLSAAPGLAHARPALRGRTHGARLLTAAPQRRVALRSSSDEAADGVSASGASPSTAPSAATTSAPAAAAAPQAPSAARTAKQVQRLTVQLLAALSSLDRGLAANPREAAEVDELCGRLEGLGGPVRLAARGSGEADLLAGTWRLVYSSGFNSGSLGGRRPGPPAALFPTILGQVYQRIDPDTAHLDNIVELLLNYGPPDLGVGRLLRDGLSGLGGAAGGLPGPLADLARSAASAVGAVEGGGGGGGAEEYPAARLTLRHDYEITGVSSVRIVYEETFGELTGSALLRGLPRLAAPSLPDPLKPPKQLRSATFEVTYLDASLRISRGDRGELRVYLRDEAGARRGPALEEDLD